MMANHDQDCNLENESPATPVRGVGGSRSLPCLYRNNSTEIKNQKPAQANKDALLEHLKLQAKYKKTSHALFQNVTAFCERFGIKNIGFLTLTFADNVQDYKVASKRLNSLATHVLNARYGHFIRVMERCKSGRIHYHLLVHVGSDIRTGFNFDGVAKRDYSSANDAIRAEWSFWRKTAKKYGFGRTELMPIKSTSDGVGRYVGKYISKHMDNRIPDDKGARLVSFSRGVRVCNTKFSWLTNGSALWRTKVRIFAHIVSERKNVPPTMEGLVQALGPKWAYNHRDFIMSLPIE